MGSADLLFGLVAGAVGSGAICLALVAVVIARQWSAKRNPTPSPEELLEFRAWKVVNGHCFGGKGLYRDIVHRWNVLERERNDARRSARRSEAMVRRLEERVTEIAARRYESSLIQVVPRLRPRDIARL